MHIRFYPLQLIVVGLMAIVLLLYVFQPDRQPLALVQMIGFVPGLLVGLVFSSFDGVVGCFSGSAAQIAFPLSLSFHLFTSGRHFLSSLTVFWTSQSLFDVALYAKDARALTYTLVGGPGHVWNALLSRLELLELDQFIGTLIYLCGVFALLVALAIGLLAARKPAA